MYLIILVHTGTYQYIPVHTSSALAAHQAGRMDWWEPSRGVGFPWQGRCESWPRLWVDRSWVESYFAGACCGWYLDNLWLCRVGVWALPWRNACQMLPVQAAEAALSWREPTGIQISIYHCIHVHTCTYQYVLVCTSTYQYVPVYTSTYHYQ